MTEFVDVVIVGAGISGISAAWHLQDRCPGKSYVILERRDNLGGTWDLFKYPGIRSDSDMFTLGFRFKPWTSEKAIADGPDDHGLPEGDGRRVRHRQAHPLRPEGRRRRLVRRRQPLDGAASSATASRWRSPPVPVRLQRLLQLRRRASRRSSRAREDFEGTIVHPQHWPEDLDYAGKKIVVIGSGATAVTLIPALANSGAGHVTMLQRSPTYIGALPDVDPFTVQTNKTLPEKAAYVVNRWKSIVFQSGAVPDRAPFPEVHAQAADDDGAAPTARGLRRREALRPELQPVGRATVPGAQRRPVQDHPRRARPTSSPTPSSGSPRPASS